jgi:hypothetical protein
MKRQHMRSGARERPGVTHGIGDHQVDVERDPRDLAQALDHRRPQGQVGDEVSVHHVDVQPVRAGALGSRDLLAQAGEVAGEDRGGDEDGLFDHAGTRESARPRAAL